MARPRKEESAEAPKKGRKPTWKPAGALSYLNVPEDYTPRWCDSDPMQLAKKRAEGWEFVNTTNFPDVLRLKEEKEKDTVKDGNALSGTIQYRELVGMMLHNDDVAARKEYYENLTRQNTAARVRRDDDKKNLSGELASAIKSPRLSVDRVVID